jgi:hypothetical protein
LFSVTVTLVMVPDNPETEMAEGNGVAVVPLAGRLMLVALLNVAAWTAALVAAIASKVAMREIHFIGMGNLLRLARSRSFFKCLEPNALQVQRA